MPTEAARKNIVYPEARVGKVERDKAHVQAPCTLPAEPGAWHAYLIKVLPPLPDHS